MACRCFGFTRADGFLGIHSVCHIGCDIEHVPPRWPESITAQALSNAVQLMLTHAFVPSGILLFGTLVVSLPKASVTILEVAHPCTDVVLGLVELAETESLAYDVVSEEGVLFLGFLLQPLAKFAVFVTNHSLTLSLTGEPGHFPIRISLFKLG